MSSYDPFNRPSKPPFEPPRKPSPDDFTRNLKQRQGSIFMLALLALLGAGVLSAYYQVEPGHKALVLRFGQWIETTGPGLHFKIPFGVDEVIKLAVDRQQKMEFGFRTQSAGVQSEFRRDPETRAEADMLTGDLNVSKVEWIIQYIIVEPKKFEFYFRDIESTLRLMAEATMRTVVGDYSFEELITGGREEVEIKAKELLVDLNRVYDTGIKIQQVKLRDVNASTDAVQAALREVESAKQERERMKKEALAEYNKVIPRAQGEAKEAIEKAKGYAIERVNVAKGDADRFKAMYGAYKRAPEITRTRLYLEAMDEVMPKAKRKVIIDSKSKSVLPLLHLNEGAK
jgi:membrane protease subunit HflK